MRSVGFWLFVLWVAVTTTWLWLRYGGRAFAVMGPLLAACGAACLAYDIVRGGVRAATRRFAEQGALATAELYEGLIRRYSELPDATHADAKREWIDESKRTMNDQLSRERDRWHAFELAEVAASLRYGALGFMLILIGSAMQSVAAIIAI